MSGTLRRVAPPSFKKAEDRDDKDGGASGPRANRAPMGRAARRAALPSCKEVEDKDDKDGGASGPLMRAAQASRAPVVRAARRVAPPSCKEAKDKDGASGPLLPAAGANRAPTSNAARRAAQHCCKEVEDKDDKNNGTMLIRTLDDWTKMRHDSQPVMVMFTSGMCGACKRIKTLYPSMKQHLPSNVTLAIVDLEQSDKAIFRGALGELAFMPAFQMYRAGQRLAYFAASDEETLRKRVEELAPVAEPRPVGCFSFLLRARA